METKNILYALSIVASLAILILFKQSTIARETIVAIAAIFIPVFMNYIITQDPLSKSI